MHNLWWITYVVPTLIAVGVIAIVGISYGVYKLWGLP